MEELIKRLERVIQTGAPDKDGMHPISAETVLEVVKELSEHGTNLASLGTDLISRAEAIDALKRKQDDGKGDLSRFYNTIIRHDIEAIMQLPPIQPEIVRCKDCKHYEHGICKKAGLCINKSPNGFCDWGEEVTT